MEPIFEAVLANDPSRIAAIEAGIPGAAAQRQAVRNALAGPALADPPAR